MRHIILIWLLAAASIVGASRIYASRTFSGSTQYLTVPAASPSNVTGTYLTISAWVKTTTTTGVHDVISRWGATNYQYGIFYGVTAGKFVFYVGNGGSANASITCSTATSAGVWYNIVGVKLNGSNIAIYLNGTSCGTGAAALALGNSGMPTCIGAQALNSGSCAFGSQYWSGNIAEVGIWNAPLTQNEITSLSTCTPPPIVHGGSSLVSYWPLWGIDSPEQDLSGNESAGSITGATAGNHVCGFLR